MSLVVIMGLFALSVFGLYLSFLSRSLEGPHKENYPYVTIEEATHISGRELQVPGRRDLTTKDPSGGPKSESSD
jgi:hypothetical protein